MLHIQGWVVPEVHIKCGNRFFVEIRPPQNLIIFCIWNSGKRWARIVPIFGRGLLPLGVMCLGQLALTILPKEVQSAYLNNSLLRFLACGLQFIGKVFENGKIFHMRRIVKSFQKCAYRQHFGNFYHNVPFKENPLKIELIFLNSQILHQNSGARCKIVCFANCILDFGFRQHPRSFWQ